MKFLWQTSKMAIENLLRNKLVNGLCLGIIAFTLLVLGIFGVVADNLGRYIARISQNISAIVYLKEIPEAAAGEADALLQELRDSLIVERAVPISASEARTRFVREFPDLGHVLTEFKESPFPASIEVTFKESTNIFTQIESFIRELRRRPLVESIQLNTDWATRIEKFKKLVNYVGLFLSLILILVTVFVVFNVIKLNIVYRSEEIKIFKLVGATNLYIRMPFLIEGLLLGTLGASLAGALLYGLLKLFSVYGGFWLEVMRGVIDLRHLPGSVYLQLVAIGAPIGFFSSLISLQRFLKPKRQSL